MLEWYNVLVDTHDGHHEPQRATECYPLHADYLTCQVCRANLAQNTVLFEDSGGGCLLLCTAAFYMAQGKCEHAQIVTVSKNIY